MKRDPRRRFVFGCTIENTQMRVWMMNRAEVVVSQPFNFITVKNLGLVYVAALLMVNFTGS